MPLGGSINDPVAQAMQKKAEEERKQRESQRIAEEQQLADLERKAKIDAETREAAARKREQEEAEARRFAEKTASFDLSREANVAASRARDSQLDQLDRQKGIRGQKQQSEQSQQDFISGLQQKAAGAVPSASELFAQQAQQRLSAQQRASAAAQPAAGVTGLRGVLRADAASRQALAQNQQELRAQEQITGRQQLIEALSKQQEQNMADQVFSAGMESQAADLEFKLQQSGKSASAARETLSIEEELAAEGARLQKDLINAQKPRLGTSLLGAGATILGTFAGGPGGGAAASAGFNMLTFNKGGKVAEKSKESLDKKSKNRKFGYKKALESNTEGSKNYSQGGVLVNTAPEGQVTKFYGGDVLVKSPTQTRRDAFTIKDLPAITEKTTATRKAATQREADAYGQQQQSRQSMANLLSQQTPSLANAQLKTASDANLAQQMAAMQQGSRAPASAALMQQALSSSQASTGQDLAKRAGQSQAQQSLLTEEQNVALINALRQQDAGALQLAEQRNLEEIAREAGIRQAEQEMLASRESLYVDELAARQSAAVQRAAVPKQGKFLGIFNQGGKVPGKAKINGDHEKNDFVEALLSPGEVVIPRTVVKKGKEAMYGFIDGVEELSDKAMEIRKPNKTFRKQKLFRGSTKVKPESEYDFNTVPKDSKVTSIDQALKKDVDFSKAPTESAVLGQTTDKTSQEVKTFSDAKELTKTNEPTDTQSAIAAAGAILGAVQNYRNKKMEIQQQKAQVDAQQFAQSLSRIRSRRNFHRGGKVSSFGEILSLRNKRG